MNPNLTITLGAISVTPIFEVMLASYLPGNFILLPRWLLRLWATILAPPRL